MFRKTIVPFFIGVLVYCSSTIIEGATCAQTQPPSQTSSAATDDPNQRIEIARRLVDQGAYARALSVLRPFADDPEKYPRHYSDYIVTLFWSGHIAEAIRRFEAMPTSLPQKSYLRRNMAKAYYDTGSYDRAGELYRSVLNETPEDGVALQGLIRSMKAAGKAQAAHEALTRFFRTPHKELSTHLLYPDLLMELGYYRLALDAFDRLLAEFPGMTDSILQHRDSQFANLNENHRQPALEAIRAVAHSGNRHAAGQVVLLSTLFRNYPAAVSAFRQYGLTPNTLPPDTAAWSGWAFYKNGDRHQAKTIFDAVLKNHPGQFRARIGSAYCLVDQGSAPDALTLLDSMAREKPENLEILYAMAYAHEQTNNFLAAIRIYERMLVLSPNNPTVEHFRARAYSDMGASSYALALAKAHFPEDHGVISRIKNDAADSRIRWQEPAVADAMLRPLTPAAAKNRATYDRIIALTQDDRFAEAVALYESLPDEGEVLPAWVLEAVAGAYLYLEQPETALRLYDAALSVNPSSMSARKGKLSVLQELRRWKPAQGLLNEIDAATPTYAGTGRRRRYNPDKLDMAITRGWAMAYENRLQAADAYFRELRETAPGNLEIRNALAHIHLWRGWPRRALEGFEIIDSMDPAFFPSKTGRISALNTLGFKTEARKQAADLLKQYPRKKSFNQLARELDVEQFNENRFSFSFSREDDGATDILVENTTSAPLGLNTRIYGFMRWRRTWDDDPDETATALGDDQATYFRRIGTGIDHIFNSNWRAIQEFSADYESGEEFGARSQVIWSPDDQWQLSTMVDTFSTDVAKRARAAGVSAKKAETQLTFRQSEWRQCGLSISRQFFSDDNDRDELLMGYEQNLFVRNDWRMRIYLNLYGVRNSEWDNPDISYFNPETAIGTAVTHMIEQTVQDIYHHGFIHRLYLTAGTYDQSGYSCGAVGSMRYEQEYAFSDTNNLLWGASLAQNLYDGDPVGSISLDLAWTLRF